MPTVRREADAFGANRPDDGRARREPRGRHGELDPSRDEAIGRSQHAGVHVDHAHQSGDLGRSGPAEHLGSGSRLEDPALGDDDHLVGQQCGLLGVVGDDDARHARRPLEPAELPAELGLHGNVERGKGFVEQQQIGGPSTRSARMSRRTGWAAGSPIPATRAGRARRRRRRRRCPRRTAAGPRRRGGGGGWAPVARSRPLAARWRRRSCPDSRIGPTPRRVRRDRRRSAGLRSCPHPMDQGLPAEGWTPDGRAADESPPDGGRGPGRAAQASWRAAGRRRGW